MAKKEKLSLDELLEQALVKEEDKPYEVPENWVWTMMNVLCDVRDGTHDSPQYVKKGIPLITSKNLKDGQLDLENINYISREDHIAISKRSKVDNGDILFAMIGTIGNPVLVNDIGFDFSIKNVALFKKNLNVLNNKYLFGYLQTHSYMNFLDRNLKGSTQKFIALGKLRESFICLPPLPEQQRIVDRIESLFEKLDRAKELAQHALESFENRKAAILHKAFTGELTRKWREENGVIFERDWVEKTLEEVCISICDGDHQPPPQTEDGIPFLVISNIASGKLSFDKTRFVPEEYYNQITDKRRPQKGDVLYSIVGSFGIPALVDQERRFCFQRHIALFRPRSIHEKYLYYVLKCAETYQKVSQIATGTAQLTVPIKGLRKIKISVPPLNEQQEIGRILDHLLDNEQKAKELCDVQDKIEHMKKAILARAFRGELGTNNPEEESALELLKEVLKEKITVN